jgi:putative serine protease PepD
VSLHSAPRPHRSPAIIAASAVLAASAATAWVMSSGATSPSLAGYSRPGLAPTTTTPLARGVPALEPATPKTTTTIGPAAALERSFVRIVKAVRPSVVQISTPEGLGSGVVYDTKGDIVTNAHVVGSSTSFTISLSNGKQLPSRLMGVFVPDDLAVVRASSPASLKPAVFAGSGSLEVGDLVLAIGSPFGLSSSVTDGIVSFNGRAVNEGNGVVLPDMVQTSAAINPGNSGGALVNLSGTVVGIPTLAASNGSGTAPGVGFAIPSSTVNLIAPQLIANGKVTKAGRAALGVSGIGATDSLGNPIGIVVTAVQPNGPAAKAGIAMGSLITAVNGKATPDMATLQTVLSVMKPGARVSVAVTNPDGQARTVSVVLGDLAQA